MIRIEKLVILGGQACDGQTTKIKKNKTYFWGGNLGGKRLVWLLQ